MAQAGVRVEAATALGAVGRAAQDAIPALRNLAGWDPQARMASEEAIRQIQAP